MSKCHIVGNLMPWLIFLSRKIDFAFTNISPGSSLFAKVRVLASLVLKGLKGIALFIETYETYCLNCLTNHYHARIQKVLSVGI